MSLGFDPLHYSHKLSKLAVGLFSVVEWDLEDIENKSVSPMFCVSFCSAFPVLSCKDVTVKITQVSNEVTSTLVAPVFVDISGLIEGKFISKGALRSGRIGQMLLWC